MEYKEIIFKYKEIINFIDNDNLIIDNDITQKNAKAYIKKYQYYYDTFTGIYLNLNLKIATNEINKSNCNIIIEFDGKEEQYDLINIANIAEKRAMIIQFRYLFPLTIKLSEYAERSSIRRDILFFLIAVIFSISLSYFFYIQGKKDSNFSQKQMIEKIQKGRNSLEKFIEGDSIRLQKIIKNQDSILLRIQELCK